MMALAVCLLIGIAYGQDYLEGGNVQSSSGSGSVMGSAAIGLTPNMGGGYVRDRSMTDPGISGMLQWLDTPVPSVPLYTTGESFIVKQFPKLRSRPSCNIMQTPARQ